MIYLPDVLELLRYLGERYRPVKWLGFDRLSLVTWLSGLEGELALFRGSKRPKGRHGYGRVMEAEITRIARLDEPARTIAATELMERIKDARSIARAAGEYLKERYGDIGEARYKESDQWWQELRSMSEVLGQPRQPRVDSSSSGSGSSISSSSS
jgi:hypothetical protein